MRAPNTPSKKKKKKKGSPFKVDSGSGGTTGNREEDLKPARRFLRPSAANKELDFITDLPKN